MSFTICTPHRVYYWDDHIRGNEKRGEAYGGYGGEHKFTRKFDWET